MKTEPCKEDEMDKNYYCSAGYVKLDFEDGGNSDGGCPEGRRWDGNYFIFGKTCQKCFCYHRKHPTPAEYKEEYGKEYPDDWAVYVSRDGGLNTGWDQIWTLEAAKVSIIFNPQLKYYIICACTPFGKPDENWRP